MERFKKKTIVLISAILITTSSVFCADNFKNSIMSLDFENGTNGAVNVILNTKEAYSGEISPKQKDATTYVIILPEIDSKTFKANTSKASNIENVEIKTLPYTSNGKGYTKITIKTRPNIQIYGQNKIYIPQRETNYAEQNNSAVNTINSDTQNDYSRENEQTVRENKNNTTTKTNNESEQANIDNDKTIQEATSALLESTDTNKPESNEGITLVLCTLLIIMIVIFLFFRAKNKMEEISGPTSKADDDEKEKEKETSTKTKQQKQSIKQKINKLDNSIPKITNYTPIKTYTGNITENNTSDLSDIVDLDALYTEYTSTQNNKEEDEEEDFLMTFLESEVPEITSDTNKKKNDEDEALEKMFKEQNDKKIESMYQEIIKNSDLSFSQEDIEKINELVNSEINSETLNNLQEYITTTTPIEPAYSKDKILEDLITTYSISCNVTFGQKDLGILQKLMDVELSPDFVTDLKTNSQTTQKIEQEIIESQYTTPPEELEAQTQNDTKITVDSDLANIDFSKYSIKSQQKSVETFQYVDNSFKVDTLDTTNLDLPDLEDAKNNPEKYYVEPEIFVPDEKVLEERILNVTFKPFYEEKEPVEKQEIFEEITKNNTVAEPNFDEEPIIKENTFTEIPPQEDTTSKNIIDNNVQKEEPSETATNPEHEEPKKENTNTEPEKVIVWQEEYGYQIDEKNYENAKKKLQEPLHNHDNTPIGQNETKYVFRNKVYILKSSTTFDEKSGCHLLYHEKDGYIVMAYLGEHMEQINAYPELKSTKIQARLSKTLPDGTQQYIIRIGTQKFIIEKLKNQIKYVLDLC